MAHLIRALIAQSITNCLYLPVALHSHLTIEVSIIEDSAASSKMKFGKQNTCHVIPAQAGIQWV